MRSLTAILPSLDDAERGLHRLRELGIRGGRLHPGDDGCRLEARIPVEVAEAASAMLREQGATDVYVDAEEWPPRNEAWLSHHQGRVTGAGSHAGQGDSEAGDSS